MFSSTASTVATAAGPRAALPVPRLCLYTEPLFVGRDGEEEINNASVLSLSFEYAPGRPRHAAAEANARRLLESVGAVEIAALDDCATVPGSRAEYVLHLDGDVHALCAFTAYSVPELRRRGFSVEIDPDYPWQAVEASAPWYAEIRGEERGDWFGLELGVEVDGDRINLLPALLDLLDRTDNLSALRRSSRRCMAVPLAERRFAAVPPERLEFLLGVLLELYGHRSGDAGQRLPLGRCGALARLGLAFADSPGQLRWRGETRVRDLAYTRAIAQAARPPAAAEGPASAPASLCADLRSYQAEGLAWLEELAARGASGILADDMGLGKTLQTIAHLLAEKERGGGPFLVVAPTSLVENWRRELARFAPSLRALVLTGPRRAARYREISEHDVLLTSYAVLVRDRDKLGEHTYDVQVLDEAHYIKNRSSLTNQAARSNPVAAADLPHRDPDRESPR